MQLLLKFLQRAGVAVIGLSLLLLIGYRGGWWFFAAVAALTVVAQSEYYSALSHKGIRPNVALGWLCALMILLVTYLGEQAGSVARYGSRPGAHSAVGVEASAHVLQLTLFVLLFCIAGTLVAQFKLRSGQSAVVNSATTVFGVVYVGVLLSFVMRMRYLDVPGLLGVEAGEFARRMGGLIFVVASVWMCDTAAFVAGNLFGRTKLAPRISPGKTVEGSIAGFLFAVLGALLFGSWLGLPVTHCALLGALMGVVGQVGDLGKSVLKRDIGIKDFGTIFGPHGGVLDRFDAVLFCMPLVYWYFWFFFVAN